MASEMINSVLQAEQKAQENEKKAYSQAENIIKEAKEKANRIADTALKNAEDKANKIVTAAGCDADVIYNDAEKNAKTKKEVLTAQSKEKESEAVKAVSDYIIYN